MSELSHLVLGICIAYESGYGHGYDQRNLSNPYCHGSNDWQAWDYGYGRAKRKRIAHDANGKEPSVIVPQYQLDKVEAVRNALHEIAIMPQSKVDAMEASRQTLHDIDGAAGGSKFSMQGVAIQSQCSILWEVANRKYEKC